MIELWKLDAAIRKLNPTVVNIRGDINNNLTAYDINGNIVEYNKSAAEAEANKEQA
jgi:hypothetical protein